MFFAQGEKEVNVLPCTTPARHNRDPVKKLMIDGGRETLDWLHQRAPRHHHLIAFYGTLNFTWWHVAHTFLEVW